MLYEQKVITLLERVYIVNMKVKVPLSCPTLCNPMTIQSMEFSRSEFSRGIFPPQGSNPGVPHCRQILYQLKHQSQHRYKMRQQGHL